MPRNIYSAEKQELLKTAYRATSFEEFRKLMLQANSSIGLAQEILEKVIHLKWLEWKNPQNHQTEIKRIEELKKSAEWMEHEKERIQKKLEDKKNLEEKEEKEIEELYEKSQKEDLQKKSRKAFDEKIRLYDNFDLPLKESILLKCETILLLSKNKEDDSKIDEFLNTCSIQEKEALQLFVKSL